MKDSSSYYDFVQSLCHVVLESDVPTNLAYIAAVQAWWCRIEESMKLIQKKYKDVPCIRPWGFNHATYERDQARNHDAVVEAIEKAIGTSLEDWMETELHLLHAFFHWPLYGDVPNILEPLEKVKRLIDANPLLNCFEPLVYAFEGMAQYCEGSIKDSLLTVQRGHELAEVSDDSLFKYINLLEQGFILSSVNIQDSLAHYEELYVMAQDLEVPYLVAEVLNDSAVAFEMAGEYDLAISSHLEKHKILETVGMPDPLLSRIYAILGNGQQALEIIDRYFKYHGPMEIPTYHLYKARALALLNRIEKAERTLDTAHSLVIKSGSDSHLGYYYHISGLIELRRGDCLAALDFLERALEISERIPSGFLQNFALLDLARAEISLDNQSTDSAKVVTPGKWLSKLEKYSIERDFHGIRMQAALIKSEFYQNHGQLKDAHATLQDALDITDSLGVATLRKRISDRIQEINRLMQDEEIVS
ncbi:MAG: hypothetical protein ACXACD_14065, partial [Candidatus Thorarchaeota archaeon]|jgi:tetratricopeptide (TPR) repeat protein